MVDLHVHSTKSDGTYTPTELVDYAVKKGLSAFALTDHDSVAGLDEAIEYAASLKSKGINAPEIIPGIEFSTEYMGQDIHILGLFIDHHSPVFEQYLKEFVESRENRNKKICEKFTEDGIPVSYDELMATFPGAVITRAHFAKFLYLHGHVKSTAEAFERYIGDNRPYHLPREKVSPEMAIELILQADGLPILAHPMLYHMSKNNLDSLVGMLKEHGLIGIEGIYSTYSASDERVVRELADKYHLLLSGGSDFHGSNKANLDLGCGYGKLYVHDTILENLKKAGKNILFTDMDGTLLLKDSTISETMKKAIDSMVSRGHKIILTSGRPLPSILERIVKLGLNFPDTYAIAFNGGLIYDVEAKKELRSVKLPQNIVRKVISIADSFGVHAHCYTNTSIVGTSVDEELKFYRSRIDMPFIEVKDIADYLTDGSFKVQLIDLKDKNKLISLREAILRELHDVVDTCFSNDYYLEILPKGISKGDAVSFLASYLPLPISHTFAAGDEDNDISMIKAAGHGIAMINGTEETKAAADIITKLDNNHDGLIEIIEKYFN